MDGLLNQLLGIHPAALKVQAARAEILSANMTNADTPNYKAQDIDFRDILNQQFNDMSTDDFAMATSDEGHMASFEFPESKLYRTPTQASLDGNTVETHIEKAHFMETALRYQVATQLISGKFSGFTKALKGE